MENTAGGFWGSLVSDYNDIIARLVSPYPEMVWTLFHYLPNEFQPSRILELGCGTGNLTKAIRGKWPAARITAVDESAEMLRLTVKRVGGENLEALEARFESLSFATGSFELITSSLALHHLPENDFRKLLSDCGEWLTTGGYIGVLDCVRARSDRLYLKAKQHWIQLAERHGITAEEMREQLAHHRTHDHYPVLVDIPGWLEDAGFVDPEILWRNSIWAVWQAQKPCR